MFHFNWRLIIRVGIWFWVWVYIPNLENVVRAAPPPIRIAISNIIGSAPLYLRIRVTLEPDTRNRWVCLYASELRHGIQITSCWEVQAEREAKTTWRELKRLTAGKWDVVAAAIRNDEQATLSNRYTIRVIGHGDEGDE